MAKRPSMAEMPISKRTLAKAEDAPAPGGTPDVSGAAARDIKSIMARVNRAGWAELRRLAIDLDTPLEDIIIGALNETLQRNGRPPVIEKRSPPPRRAV